MCPVHIALRYSRWRYGSLSLSGARQHFDTLRGFIPGLIVVRVAPIRRPLGIFHKRLRRRCGIVPAKQTSSLFAVGDCAADVATTTRIFVLPFRGMPQIRGFSQTYRTNDTLLHCLRPLSPDPHVVKLRFTRNGCAPMRGTSRASYRGMWRNVECGKARCRLPDHTSTRQRLGAR